jgi:hypothetical protein
MSSIPPFPPEPPAFPPPPPPPGTSSDSIPWERREQLGFGPALVETVKLFVTDPQNAYRRTREKGDLTEPLLFAVIVSWVGIVASSIYGLFLSQAWMNFLPMQMREKMGMRMPGAFGAIGQIILGPVIVAIGLFIGAAILHLCFMVVGALSASTAGFEGTFRVVAYAAVADLANVIPFAGGLIGAVWKIVLVVIGAVALHKTTTGKAVAGVLIPIVVCCVCVIVFGVMIGGMIASFARR